MKLKQFFKSKFFSFFIAIISITATYAILLTNIPSIAQAQETLNSTHYTIPTNNSQPDNIVRGPDGNLWFTELTGNKIGRITPGGTITEFVLTNCGTNGCGPKDITVGPDGNLWFTEANGGKIGKITPSGEITEYNVSGGNNNFLVQITSGPDGNLWFTEFNFNRIGRITPSGTITLFNIPDPNARPSGITAGPDGNLWFTETQGDKIGRITPTGTITEFTIPTSGSYPVFITPGPDGNLWFTEHFGNKVGKITPSGVITEFPIPGGASPPPRGITTGPDGNLWFVKGNIWRITPAGILTEFSADGLPQNLEDITLGPDGNLWFTNPFGNKIGWVNPTPISITPTPAATPTPTPPVSLCMQNIQPSTSTTTMSQQYYINATVYNQADSPQSGSFRVSESGFATDYHDTPGVSRTVAVESLAGKTSQTFNVGPFSHTWRWLLPIERLGTTGIIDRFMGNIFLLKQIHGVISGISGSGTAIVNDVLTFFQALVDADKAKLSVNYTYTYNNLPQCDSQSPLSTDVKVNVPIEKKSMLMNSWVTDWVAGKSTTYGILSALHGNVIGSLALLDVQVVLKNLAIVWLLGAEDPDSNYTQIVQAAPVTLPLSQTYTGTHAAAFSHLGKAISEAQAATVAFAKADGAAEVGDTEWKTIQHRSARDFLTRTLYELTAFDANADWFKTAQQEYVNTPNALDQVTQYLQQNGLPQSEIDSLTQLGFTSEDITNTLNVQLSMMPAFQGNYATADPTADLFPPVKDMLDDVRNDLADESSGSIDTIPPTSQIALQGELGKANWYNSSVQVTITSADNSEGSGIKATEYSLDKGISWQTYTSPFTISSNGINSVLSRAIDNEGNIEFPPQKKEVKIDKIAPELIISFNTQTRLLQGAGEDDLSGIDTVTQTGTGLTIKDKAGNTSQFLYSNIMTKVTKTGTQIMTINSLKYNNVAKTIPKANITIAWTLDNTNALNYLIQTFAITGQESIVAIYDTSKSKTTSLEIKKGTDLKKVTTDGLTLIKLKSKNGTLTLSY